MRLFHLGVVKHDINLTIIIPIKLERKKAKLNKVFKITF